MDCEFPVIEKLCEKESNIIFGSFGQPYSVKDYLKTRIQFPIKNYSFPTGFEDQEVIVIDLKTKIKSGSFIEGPEPTEPSALQAAPINQQINPRPIFMDTSRTSFDRILDHGGNFIIFADPQETIEYHSWSRNKGIQGKISLHNWSFLSLFTQNNFQTQKRFGKEVVIHEKSPLSENFLKKYISDVEYKCCFSSPRNFKQGIIPILKNKYQEIVAGIIPVNEKGKIFIFPHFTEKGQFLEDFIFDILPILSPHLFPSNISDWIKEKEYELPRILEIKDEIKKIKNEAQRQIQDKKIEIGIERKKQGFIQDLLTETGSQLVDSVQKVLQSIGFKKVVNMDKEESEKTNQRLREDLQIRDHQPILLIEVKGISGLPKDEDSLQVSKYLFPRAKELGTFELQGLSIINHQRNLPPVKRQDKKLFHEDILTNAKEQGFGLMTTWDLFKLARSFQKNNWKHEHIKDIFYQTERILPLPSHYQLLGIVDEIWKEAQAIGIKIENGYIQKGCKLAFEFANEFEEQEVTSLQLEGENQDKIDAGKVAGIKVSQINSFKKKIRVYKVVT